MAEGGAGAEKAPPPAEKAAAHPAGPPPKKGDWEKDVVYLFQFPRASCVPSISPFCLKLETWLRMADIKYENVDCGQTTRSKKGQMPFVELNGAEIADSEMIIKELIRRFNKDFMTKHLSEQDAAVVHAMKAILDGSLVWVSAYMRSVSTSRLFQDDVYGKNFSSAPAKLLRPVMSWRFSNILKTKLYHHGMGRNSPEEATQMGIEDLKALSTFLGDKKYTTGNTPIPLDAAMFGMLAQIHYVPLENDLKKYFESECQNLVVYLERIKTEFWPDWEEACRSLSLHTDSKKGPPPPADPPKDA